MEITIEFITPSVAAEMLVQNTGNRPMSEGHMRRLAANMRAGAWQLNGDAIRFSSSGRLLDGQHRLAACVFADMPMQSVVVRGLPDDAFKTIDIHTRSRRMADLLGIAGVSNGAVKASAAMRFHLWSVKGSPDSGTIEDAPQFSDIRRIVAELIDPEWDLLKHTQTHGVKVAMNGGEALFCAMAFLTASRGAAWSWIMQMQGMANDYNRSNAIQVLRNRLLQDRQSRRSKMPVAHRLALTFKAYKALLEGRDIHSLGLRDKEAGVFTLPGAQSPTEQKQT